MHLSSAHPSVVRRNFAASEQQTAGTADLRGRDVEVDDLCRGARMLDARYRSAVRSLAEAEHRGDIESCAQIEAECVTLARNLTRALTALSLVPAASPAGLMLKAEALSRFLPRVRDEADDEDIGMVGTFAQELSVALPSTMPIHGGIIPEAGLNPTDFQVLAAAVLEQLDRRAHQLLVAAEAASALDDDPLSLAQIETACVEHENELGSRLRALAVRAPRDAAETVALANVVASLARQGVEDEASNFVITLGLQLCDAVLYPGS